MRLNNKLDTLKSRVVMIATHNLNVVQYLHIHKIAIILVSLSYSIFILFHVISFCLVSFFEIYLLLLNDLLY